MTTYQWRNVDGALEVTAHGRGRERELAADNTVLARVVLEDHLRSHRADMALVPSGYFPERPLTTHRGPDTAALILCDRFRNVVAARDAITSREITRWIEAVCEPLIAEARKALRR